MKKDDKLTRCSWAEASDEEQTYHDTEWGVPTFDDARLFEFLVLESAQAGLSWRTILNKRDGYRRAFAGFDPNAIARFTEADVERLLEDSDIIRNRKKIEATITNAKAFLAVQESFGSFSRYIWGFVEGSPVNNRFIKMTDIPAQTELSTLISRDLKKRGFKFLGPVTVYAFMQATGMVNDHIVSCFRHDEVAASVRA